MGGGKKSIAVKVTFCYTSISTDRERVGCVVPFESSILAGMNKVRLETFSDGVIAILITIMVLELHAPAGAGAADLRELAPTFLSYVLSFIFLGIYWNNHHHLWDVADRVNGSILWANMHLLFWLSLVPFVTAWMGQANFARFPVALYGFVMWMCGLAYYLLTRSMVTLHGTDSRVGTALRSNFKERVSLVAYGLAIPLAFVHTAFALALYVLVALIWLIPDQRIEKIVDS